MITMEVKGITWVGNLYQKFENMCLEAEEMIYEDTVKYLENQAQTVGESVKKFYADVLQDLLPPSSCDLDEKVVSELPIDQDTDVVVPKKSILGPKERTPKVDIKRISKDLRINHDVDKDVTFAASYAKSCDTDVLLTSTSRKLVKVNKFDSHARQRVRSTNIRSNLSPTKTVGEIPSTETETCRTASSEILSKNHEVPCHHAATISSQSSTEVTMSELVSDCCYENENASAEEIPDLPVFDNESAEEKVMNMCPSSSGVLSRELNGFSMERVTQSDDCSYSTVILSHHDGWNFDIDTITEEGHETVGKDYELKLEQSCVMISGDEVQLFPKAGGNQRMNKKKIRQVFSLGKKSGRKQEYEQLAVWHGNSEKGKADSMENSVPDSAEGDLKKPMLSNISEPEWEVL